MLTKRYFLFFVILTCFFLTLQVKLSTAGLDKLSGGSDVRIWETDFHEGVVQLYFFKRLEKAMSMLHVVHKKKIFPMLCEQIGGGGCKVFDESIRFEYESIATCKQQIEDSKSIKPLLDLWSDIKKRTKVKSNLKPSVSLLREFSIMILLVYRTIYMVCSPLVQLAVHKNLILEAASLLFGNFASLHAFELLGILEKLTSQIPKLLEKYELNNKELTWGQWAEKYWWIAPIATAAIVFEVTFLYQVAVGKQKVPLLKSAMRFFTDESEENKKANSSA